MKRLVLFFMVFALIFVNMAPAHADELSKAKEEKKNIEQEMKNVAKDKKEYESKIKETENQKKALEEERKKADSELKNLQSEVATLNDIILALDAELEAAEDKYQNQVAMLKTRIKVMYENSSVTYLQTLIESKSIIDFFERLQLISLISENDKNLVEELDAAKKDLDYKRQMKESQKKKLEEDVKDKEEKIQSLVASRNQADRKIKEYEMTLEDLEKREDELIKKSQEITKRIEKLMSEAQYSGGIMKWPCPSSTTISSYYGNRYHPILKKNKLHTGIDIAAARGASIVAAAAGTVIVAEWQTGYGNTVIIDHGGKIATLYGHADKILVKVGDKVKAGDTIAKVGSTGWSTGPHLHFEVIKNGQTQNPLDYLGKKK
ncbi:peptidase M23 [Clostridium thermosuccinogenes]|uniref:Peptidase M23 n=1 Tax=Clostridium thermosuccinogenes TaxID=84032 RepID=A0A2K2FCM0_9CLOT|nr:peptidoglycan DD-metalloendopeptidase family protein [Pseudoclostridium thermosuccinogenes]AUS95516.1 peptidase M23 [Pseudoclostridium thermosuccinogenes]PNT96530.1 peptidase M23 [Pseudoclostridium thermosuccinogenes]PNT98273.1 peptidase M23 [Pseudoclostridium thermosuccinogenes]